MLSDTSVVVVDEVSYDINSFIIYPSRKSYFQAEELPKDYDLGEAPKNSPKGLRQSREYKELLHKLVAAQLLLRYSNTNT